MVVFYSLLINSPSKLSSLVFVESAVQSSNPKIRFCYSLKNINLIVSLKSLNLVQGQLLIYMEMLYIKFYRPYYASIFSFFDFLLFDQTLDHQLFPCLSFFFNTTIKSFNINYVVRLLF